MEATDEDRAEVERLKLIPIDEQRAIIALHQSVAKNPKVPEAERAEARRKAAILARLLGLKRKK